MPILNTALQIGREAFSKEQPTATGESSLPASTYLECARNANRKISGNRGRRYARGVSTTIYARARVALSAKKPLTPRQSLGKEKKFERC